MEEYVESFGFGRKLDSDFLGEGNGYVPDRKFYDRRYRKSWNALTVLSLSIGQGSWSVRRCKWLTWRLSSLIAGTIISRTSSVR